MASGKPRVSFDRPRVRNIHGYTVEKEIGRGSFGKVYLVRKDKQKWAMKEVNLNLRAKDMEHCIGECQVMRECNHPNLVKLHESFQQENKLHIIMEYCERGSLKDFLQTTDLEEKVIVNFMTQICKALQFLHRKGKIHRDVKTANIFITKAWILKLGDMALTRDVRENFEMTRLPGTPVYMSPEVIQSRPYDQKADVWSLGCCFYEMCIKVSLFLATDFESLKEMIEMCKRTNKLCIPLCEELNKIFKLMMSFEPENRPTIDKVLAHLETYSSPPNTQTSPKSSTPSDQDYSHRETGRVEDRTSNRLGNSYSRHLRESTTDLNDTSDYGTDTELRNEEEPRLVSVPATKEEPELVPIPVQVWMSVDQQDWYQKKNQLLIDIRKRVGDKILKRIRQELRLELQKSKADKSSNNFLTVQQFGPSGDAAWRCVSSGSKLCATVIKDSPGYYAKDIKVGNDE